MRRTSRMKRVGLAGLCCGLGLMATSLLWAQQPGAEGRQQRQTPGQERQQARGQAGEKQFCLASELIGLKVKAKGDEEAGQVKNLIINAEGQVQYLAVSGSAEGEAGATPSTDRPQQQRQEPGRAAQAAAGGAGQLTLIPWAVAKLQIGATPSQSHVMVDIEKDALAKAPSFTQQQLMAAATQAQVEAQVNQYFSRQQRGAARPELERERQQPEGQPRENPQQEQDRNN